MAGCCLNPPGFFVKEVCTSSVYFLSLKKSQRTAYNSSAPHQLLLMLILKSESYFCESLEDGKLVQSVFFEVSKEAQTSAEVTRCACCVLQCLFDIECLQIRYKRVFFSSIIKQTCSNNKCSRA